MLMNILVWNLWTDKVISLIDLYIFTFHPLCFGVLNKECRCLWMIDDDTILMFNDAEPDIVSLRALVIGVHYVIFSRATPVCFRGCEESEESSINFILIFLNKLELGLVFESAILLQVSMALICLAVDIHELVGGTEGNVFLINGVVSLWQFSIASIRIVVVKATAI